MLWTIHRHFKGNLYLEIGTALHSETKEPLVIYRCLYDNDLASTWVRPTPSFEGFTPDGKRRFEPVATLQAHHPHSVSSLDSELRPPHIPTQASTFTLNLPQTGPVSALSAVSETPSQSRIIALRTLPSFRQKGHATTLLRAFMGVTLQLSGKASTRFLMRAPSASSLLSRCGFGEPSQDGDRSCERNPSIA